MAPPPSLTRPVRVELPEEHGPAWRARPSPQPQHPLESENLLLDVQPYEKERQNKGAGGGRAEGKGRTVLAHVLRGGLLEEALHRVEPPGRSRRSLSGQQYVTRMVHIL